MCNTGWTAGYGYCKGEPSRAFIAGLRDGLFPNLQELLALKGRILIKDVIELAEVLRVHALCARTLGKVVISGGQHHGPVDIRPLQAVLPHATVMSD